MKTQRSEHNLNWHSLAHNVTIVCYNQKVGFYNHNVVFTTKRWIFTISETTKRWVGLSFDCNILFLHLSLLRAYSSSDVVVRLEKISDFTGLFSNKALTKTDIG